MFSEKELEDNLEGLSNYSRRLLRGVSPEDREDIFMTTVERAWKHRGRFNGQSSLFTWLCTICNRVISSYWRKRLGRANKAIEISTDMNSYWSPDKDHNDPALHDHMDLSSLVDEIDLERKLEHLSDDQAIVVRMMVRGYKTSEIDAHNGWRKRTAIGLYKEVICILEEHLYE